MTSATFSLPTEAELLAAYALLGRRLRGGIEGQQRAMMRSITQPGVTHWIGQVCRQAFKTEVSALYAAVAIMKGGVVALGMPAMNQAAVVKRKRILHFLDHFEQLGLVQRVGTGHPFHLSQWTIMGRSRIAQIGELQVVNARAAMQTTRRKSTQTGRTANVLDLDEGESLYGEDIEELDPAISVALSQGVGRLNIVGVGGPSDSVIEARKRNGYATFWCNDEMFLADNPEFASVFAQMRADNTDEWSGSNLGCLPLALGTRRVFPELAVCVDPPAQYGKARWVHACDVGRSRDFTVIAHLKVWAGGIVHVVAFTQIPHGNLVEQARYCFEAINRPEFMYGYRGEDVAVETNGIGGGLADIMARNHFPRLTPVHLMNTPSGATLGMKDRLVNSIRVDAREHRLQISEEARMMRMGDPPQRIDDLTYSMNERGGYIWPHHDGFSALVVGYHVIGGSVGFEGKQNGIPVGFTQA